MAASAEVRQRLRGSEATVEQVVSALDHHGYCILENLMPESWARAVSSELRGVLASTPTGRNRFEGFGTRRMYALYAKTRSFDAPAIHPLVLGTLDHVLGRHYHLSSVVGIDIGPGEKAQVLHRDTNKYPLPAGFPEVVVNTMWALDDFTAANGATLIFPNSHTRIKAPDPSNYAMHPASDDGGSAASHLVTLEHALQEVSHDPSRLVQATMPAGSIMFYRGSLIHGGGANCTQTPRLGVILEYCASWLRPQENHCLAVPREVASRLPERLQELLGYNIYPPFVGYVDGRHPRKSLL